MTRSVCNPLAAFLCATLAFSGLCRAQLQTSGLSKPGSGGLSSTSSLGLSRGGPKRQRTELQALLTDAVPPSTDRSAGKGAPIYGGVTYLMPLDEAIAKAGLAGKLKSGGRSAAVGFPDGFLFTEISADGQRAYATRMVIDETGRVVAVEFAAVNPRQLPPAPELLPPPTRTTLGGTYDFVPEGVSGAGQRYLQNVWHRKDYVLIATRNGPKCADLYIPKPMVAVILGALNATLEKK